MNARSSSVVWRLTRNSQSPAALLQSWSPRTACGRSFGSTSRRWEQKGDAKQSFQGQLYESTAQRLHRERADEARYIKAQEENNPKLGQRTLLLSLSKCESRSKLLLFLTSSRPPLCRWSLLLSWLDATQKTAYHFHHASRSGPASRT